MKAYTIDQAYQSELDRLEEDTPHIEIDLLQDSITKLILLRNKSSEDLCLEHKYFILFNSIISNLMEIQAQGVKALKTL